MRCSLLAAEAIVDKMTHLPRLDSTRLLPYWHQVLHRVEAEAAAASAAVGLSLSL